MSAFSGTSTSLVPPAFSGAWICNLLAAGHNEATPFGFDSFSPVLSSQFHFSVPVLHHCHLESSLLFSSFGCKVPLTAFVLFLLAPLFERCQTLVSIFIHSTLGD